MSGQLRLGLVFFAPLAAVAMLVVVFLPDRMDAIATESAERHALTLANVVAELAAPALQRGDDPKVQEVLRTLASQPDLRRAALRRADGSLRAWLPIDRRDLAETLPIPASPTTARTLRRDDDLDAVVPIAGVGGTRGTLVISFSLDDLRAERRSNLAVTLLVALATVAVGIASSLLLLRFVGRRRRVEQALARSEQNFRAVIEGSPDAMIVETDGVVSYANPAAARLLARPRSIELVGQPIADVLPGAPSVEAEPTELRLDTPAGERLAEVHALARVFDSAPARLLVARDVTEKRDMQARLLLADRMASVGTLAAGVAHEINNPLSFVIANLSYVVAAMARGPIEPDEQPELLEALRDAQQGSDRVKRIVKDLKTFSRADDDQRKPVSLQGAMDLALQMTWTEIKHRARLEKRYSRAPLVNASDSRLGQVFVNLIVNATQALPEECKSNLIVVATGTDEHGWAVVEVSDNGKGIAAETMKRIFDPFFTTKAVGVGTGLGLSICHSIVTSLGGHITVASRPTAGTTFTVSLPPSGPADVEAPELEPVPPLPRRARVLVIDDEVMVGQAVRRTLGGHAEISCLTDAREALARLSSGERFDVILCDLIMPDMTGMELHDALAIRAPETLARMIFITGGVFGGRARAFIDEKQRPFLEKPFEPDALRRAVKDVFEATWPTA